MRELWQEYVEFARLKVLGAKAKTSDNTPPESQEIRAVARVQPQ